MIQAKQRADEGASNLQLKKKDSVVSKTSKNEMINIQMEARNPGSMSAASSLLTPSSATEPKKLNKEQLKKLAVDLNKVLQ